MMIGYALLLISVAELALGIFLITKYQHSQAKIWYGLFCIAVAIYVAGNGLGYIKDSVFFLDRIAWVGAILTSTFILPFSFTFPLPRKKFSELWPLVIWPIVVFIPTVLGTEIFFQEKGINSFRGGHEIIQGPYFFALVTSFAIYWLWALANLFWRRSQSDGVHRRQLTSILIGIVVSLAISVTTDIIVPLVSKSTIGYVGSMFSAVWLGFTAYIILRK